MDRAVLAICIIAIAVLSALAVHLFYRQRGKALPNDLGSLDDEGWGLLKRRVVGSVALAAVAVLVGCVLARVL